MLKYSSVNGKEALGRIADLVLGKKVEGTVSAVLPSQLGLSRRYAIATKDGILDTHFSAVSRPLFPIPIYFPKPYFSRGQRIAERAVDVKPWVDGQIIHF